MAAAAAPALKNERRGRGKGGGGGWIESPPPSEPFATASLGVGRGWGGVRGLGRVGRDLLGS